MIQIGSSAWSGSKTKQMRDRLLVMDLRAYHCHAIQAEFTSPELQELLSYSKKPVENIDQMLQNSALNINQPIPAGWHMFFVFPRPGTISPWSSKATDIAKICQIQLERIERGTLIFLQTNDMTREKEMEISGRIHDKMTHVVFCNIPNENVLFPTPLPRPLESVDLVSTNLQDPISVLEKANIEWVIILC